MGHDCTMGNTYADLFGLSLNRQDISPLPPLFLVASYLQMPSTQEEGEREEAVKSVVSKFKALWEKSFEQMVC